MHGRRAVGYSIAYVAMDAYKKTAAASSIEDGLPNQTAASCAPFNQLSMPLHIRSENANIGRQLTELVRHL